MNWERFRKNLGMRFQLAPPARSVTPNGEELQVQEPDHWILQSFTGPETFELSRVASGHVAKLAKDHVFDFRSDPAGSSTGTPCGFLVLKMQVEICGNDVRLLPNAKPGEPVPPRVVDRSRHVSRESRASVLAYLGSQPRGVIGFASTQGDSEAHDYKEQLIALFQDAGWDVRDMQTFLFFGSKKGLVVTIPFGVPESGMPQIVMQALQQIGGPLQGSRGDMANECQHFVQVWSAP